MREALVTVQSRCGEALVTDGHGAITVRVVMVPVRSRCGVVLVTVQSRCGTALVTVRDGVVHSAVTVQEALVTVRSRRGWCWSRSWRRPRGWAWDEVLEPMMVECIDPNFWSRCGHGVGGAGHGAVTTCRVVLCRIARAAREMTPATAH